MLPICSILTIPGGGQQRATAGSVITNEDGNYKLGYSHPSLFPVFSILNPETTFTLPPYQTAAGAVDTIAHTLGAYITDDTESYLVQNIGESVIRTVVKYAPIALENPTDYNARAQLMWAATTAANSTISNGCRHDGTSHIVEHELSALYDITHGAGLASSSPAGSSTSIKSARRPLPGLQTASSASRSTRTTWRARPSRAFLRWSGSSRISACRSGCRR